MSDPALFPFQGGRAKWWLRAACGAPLRATALLVLLLTALAGRAETQVMDDHIYNFLLFDQFEFAPGGQGRPLSLDAIGWIGGDVNRLWVRAEGERLTAGAEGEGEAQALYGRLIAPYFDAVVGVRVDRRWGDGADTRGFLAAGLEGLAPYWFEVAPTLFVSQKGDMSARLEAEYELLFTQRLVLTPEVELNVALQEVPEWGIGKGLNDLELGLRLRYELRREFAPYVGYQWLRRIGDTADFAREGGERTSDGAFVAGVRLWR